MSSLAIKKKVNLLRTGLNALFKPNKVNQFPIQANMEITNACNLNCMHCSRQELRDGQFDDYIHPSEFYRRIEEISPDFVSIAGLGEPTLHPDLIEMLNWLSDRKIASSITTNGTTLKKYAEKFVDSGLKVITLSIDSPIPPTYTSIRGKNMLPHISNGLQKLQEIKKKKKSNTPEVSIHIVVQRDNIDEFGEMLNFATKHNICMLYFVPLEVSTHDQVQELIGTIIVKEVMDRLKLVWDKSKRLQIGTNIRIWMRDQNLIWKKYSVFDDQVRPISRRPCIRPWVSTYIDVKGDVYPCCILAFQPHMNLSMGNIQEHSFEKIWNGIRYSKCRQVIKSGQKSIKGCDVCVPLKLTDKFYFFLKRGLFK